MYIFLYKFTNSENINILKFFGLIDKRNGVSGQKSFNRQKEWYFSP
jgi:hypothetical protein